MLINLASHINMKHIYNREPSRMSKERRRNEKKKKGWAIKK